MFGSARRWSLTLVSLCLATGLAGCGPGAPEEGESAPEDAIPQVVFDADSSVAAWVELWATYDLDKVEDLFLADPDPTYFSSEKQGLIVGLDAIREHHAGFGFVPGGGTPASELWLEKVRAEVFGTTAVVTAIWCFGERSAAGSESAADVQKGPMTAVFVLDGDVYKIAHMNFAEYLPASEEESG